MSSEVMTLAQLRVATRERADMIGSEFVSESELSDYINQSLFALYDLLVTTYGEDYFVDDVQVTADEKGVTDLPANFYKLRGVDILIDGVRAITLQPFNFAERNRASINLSGPLYTQIRYRLRANKLWLTPPPTTSQALRIWYVPRMKPLLDPVLVTVSALLPGDTVGTSVKKLVADTDFAIGANHAETAANLCAALLADVDFVDFDVSVAGNVLTISVVEAEPVTTEWVTSNNVRLRVSGGLVPTGPTFTGRSAPAKAQVESDGISGWLEFVIIDAAIKCLQKEESDTRVLMAQRAGLVQRINDSASSRDAGAPPTVTDSSRTGSWDDTFRPGNY